MKYNLSAFSIWEYGQRKDAAGLPHQEDSLFPAAGELKDTDRLFIVCDGMGGHDAGEVASATVCEAMAQAVAEKVAEPEGDFSDEVFRYALDKAYEALDARDTGAVKKMGTTLTFLKLHNGGATIAHMGDSRVYHIRPGKDAESTAILHVTRDHSLLNSLLDIGELTEEDIPHFQQKNVITRAMQPHTEPRCKAELYHTADIRPGDYFYLCTDGMLENTSDDHLRFIFSDAIPEAEKKDTLIKVTHENRDNHSAIVVHILGVEEAADAPTGEAAHQPVMGIVDDASDEEQNAQTEKPTTATKEETKPAQPAEIIKDPSVRPRHKRRWLGMLVVLMVLTALMAAFWLGLKRFAHGQQEETPTETQTETTVRETA
ncbi:MAG: protein phosphatase 2C domain-containing protein [Bacteroidaceae bacterium]